MATDYEIFDELLNKVRGMENKSITLTKNDVYKGDNFLIFGVGYDEHTITLKRRYDGVWVVLFDHDERILLENCPPSFWKTLLKNLK